MPLTHTRELFAKALKGKYALGAFNVNNMELIQAIVEACEEEKAPLILQISKGARSDSALSRIQAQPRSRRKRRCRNLESSAITFCSGEQEVPFANSCTPTISPMPLST